jgi:hypothetical protein
MGQLFSLLDGSSDSARYEDMCRQLLSNKGYFVYTLDKVRANNNNNDIDNNNNNNDNDNNDNDNDNDNDNA